jgi:hypothetical protein
LRWSPSNVAECLAMAEIWIEALRANPGGGSASSSLSFEVAFAQTLRP